MESRPESIDIDDHSPGRPDPVFDPETNQPRRKVDLEISGCGETIRLTQVFMVSSI